MTPNYQEAVRDVFDGFRMHRMWGRMGWAEIRRRYRRTVFGPFWTSVSLAVFVVTMGVVWSNLWKLDPKDYLVFLTSGMLVWVLLTSFMTEGCMVFISYEGLIKQLPITYTMLIYTLIWRNLIVFGHNLLIYFPIYIYSGRPFSLNFLFVLPALVILCVNGVWIG